MEREMVNGLNGSQAGKMFQKFLLLMSPYQNQKNPGVVAKKLKADIRMERNMENGQSGMIMNI